MRVLGREVTTKRGLARPRKCSALPSRGRASCVRSEVASEARLDDWRALIAQKDDLVAGLRQGKYIDVLPKYNTIAYMEGPALIGAEGTPSTAT